MDDITAASQRALHRMAHARRAHERAERRRAAADGYARRAAAAQGAAAAARARLDELRGKAAGHARPGASPTDQPPPTTFAS